MAAMRIKLGLAIVAALAVLAGVALWLVNDSFSTQVELINEARRAIETVHVRAADHEHTCRNLAPGARCAWSIAPSRDGSFAVDGRFADGQPISAQDMGYTTAGDPMDHVLRVRDDGTIDYAQPQ